MVDRNELRNEKLKQRMNLSFRQVRDYSQEISLKLPSIYPLKMAKNVMAFAAIRNEVDLGSAIMSMKKDGCRILLPRVEDKQTITAVEFQSWEAGKHNKFGIFEPEGPAVAPTEIDAVLVPGLVFDAAGFRLGYGRGYYDRFLPKLREDAFRCGVCYDFQVVDTVAPQPNDVPVHWIVTEKSELAIDFNYF